MTDYPPRYMQGKVYPAVMDRQLMASLARPGVFKMSEFASSASGSSRAVSVSAGNIFVQGSEQTTQGMYHCFADAAVNVTIAPVASQPRIDSVYVVVRDSNYSGANLDFQRVVQQGTESAGADLDNRTGANATVPNNSFWICDVLATVGSGLIPAANVRDKRLVRKGYVSIPASESRAGTITAYGTMPTPDIVRNIELPAGGKIRVAYEALWQYSGTTPLAAIFLGANQLQAWGPAGTGTLATGHGVGVTNTDCPLTTATYSLTSSNFTASTVVTTGQSIGFSGSSEKGGVCEIFAAAGTYDISVQYKAATGNVTAKNRQLWVEVVDLADFR